MSRYFSPRIFSLIFGCAYTLAVIYNLPLFYYFPAVKHFSLHDLPLETFGPGMSWFGWIATAALAAILAAVMFPLILPKRWIDQMPSGVFWLVPLAMLIGGLFREQDWLLK